MGERTAVAALIAGALLGAAPAARAAGLFLTDRGVRPMARGGAFVAGADDPGAVFYNPAGIAFSGKQLLFDATWIDFTGSYTRKLRTRQLDPNTGQPTGAQFDQTFETVHASPPALAIPTLAYTTPLGERFTIALGVGAPSAATGEWPRTVDGRPAPQRYSLLNTSGSLLLTPGLWAAWRPSRQLAIGAGMEALVGTLSTDVMFSSCPQDRLLCAQEQSDYDTEAKLTAGPIFAPSGNLGVIWAPSKDVRVGGAFQLPYYVHSRAKLDLALPTAPTFYDARQVGNDADVDFKLPWDARFGVEVRTIPRTRVELAWVLEHWSMHDRIDVTPDGIQLVGVQNFPEKFALQPITLQRHFRDSLSLRLGAEHLMPVGARTKLAVRAGVQYERSAVPPQYLNVSAFDVDKVVVSLGAGVHTGHWRVDLLLAELIAPPVEVGTTEAAIVPTNPVKANPPAFPYRVNAGTYRASATLVGLGVAYAFDRSRVSQAGGW